MEQMGLPQVVAAIDEHCRSGDHERAGAMLWPALDQFPHVGALWFYAAALFMEEGKSVLAMACWEKCYQLECNPEVLVNLGAAARLTNQVELARATLERLLEIRPDDAKALSNLTGGYVNEGNPKPGIAYGERCLQLDPEAKQGRFNLGLLYLEDGQYGKGFDCYADGFHRLRHPKVYTPDPPYLTPERFAELKQVAFKPRLIVAGEQGLGDEIMFSTMLDDVLEDFDVILDGHPRLESLYRRSRFASRITIHGTRKVDSPEWSHEAHAKVMIGDLGRFYRRTPESFRWTGPVHSADPVEAGQLRAHLQSIAKGRPIIGLALRGGTVSTNRKYRGLPMSALGDLLKQDALFVSLDYEDVGDEVSYLRGLGKDVFWCPAILWHFDYLHTAALVAATDRVVTCCQSIAHLSAAMGHRVDVMVPSKPAWRYGLRSESWFWYPHSNARLLRQYGDDWTPASQKLSEAQETGLLSGWPMGNAFQTELKRWDVLAGLMQSNGYEHMVDVDPWDGRVVAAVSGAIPEARFSFYGFADDAEEVRARFKENTKDCKGALRENGIDMVYIEGTKPEKVSEHIADWYPKLRDGGMMVIGNFKHQEGIPVMRAVAQMFPLYAVAVLPDNLAMVQKGAV